MTPSNRLKSPRVSHWIVTVAFVVLPDFGFLTLADAERRKARRERDRALRGLPGWVMKSADFRRNPRSSARLRKEKGQPRGVGLIYMVEQDIYGGAGRNLTGVRNHSEIQIARLSATSPVPSSQDAAPGCVQNS